MIDRELPDASREVLLVLDATTGQNAISQAKSFGDITDVTGIVLTKLDGTAKGGIVIAVASSLNMPVKFIGVGEQMDDLQRFNAKNLLRPFSLKEQKTEDISRTKATAYAMAILK